MHNIHQNIYSDLTPLGSADRYLDDVADKIDQVQFLQPYNQNELMVLFKHLTCYGAPRDYTLFEEGYESNHMLMILSGTANMYSASSDVSTLLAFGSTIGQVSLVEPFLWQGTCQTNSPMDIAVMTRQSLDQILIHNPRLGNKVLLSIIDAMSLHYKKNVINHLQTPHTIAN